MITIDGKIFRNLEEQVQKNKEDIANHYNVDRVLADFGIRVIGNIADASELPDPATFSGEYGDAYAVGAESPYTFYIWTRADVDAGHPNDYWLDIGQLAIQGERGPEGPRGPQGPRGAEGTQWFTGAYSPINQNIAAEDGDMYLDITNGQVYKFFNNSWQTLTNISGPQGGVGPAGSRGPEGPQGPQGPKGDRGDVGGFINVVGVVPNVNSLPSPSTLGDLTKAYLVGDDKLLYIQIGETSATALWTNMGPLNVATLVTVGGKYQNTWNADTKVDCANSPLVVHVTNEKGEESKAIKYGGANVIFRIPQWRGKDSGTYDWGGLLTTGTPVNPYNCATKKYVDDAVAAIPSGGSVYKHTITAQAYSMTQEWEGTLPVHFTFYSSRPTPYTGVSPQTNPSALPEYYMLIAPIATAYGNIEIIMDLTYNVYQGDIYRYFATYANGNPGISFVEYTDTVTPL